MYPYINITKKDIALTSKPYAAILFILKTWVNFFLREFTNCKIARNKDSMRKKFPNIEIIHIDLYLER